ncbi:MAG: protein kinase [Deltaproteobacteria bacterium]|nr:protein kinase [Deltaproteobacteria bacterium]
MSAAADQDLRLGRYVLKRLLGEGGNGQVFLAWQDNATGDPLVCVIKIPLQRLASKPEGQIRSMHEARLAMWLGTHPNIVQVIDVGLHRQMPFIAMEYVNGMDLHQMLKRLRAGSKGLSLGCIYHIVASAAAGLHHAHVGATVNGKPVGVVHRDIKPANILVTRDGVTKLGDFGIGTTVDDGTPGQYVRGTYRYMSPEHLNTDIRPEMDIYGLGVVAWEMIENRVYREHCQGIAHFAPILDGDVPPMENSAAPGQLVSIVQACLEPNPRQRPDARELLRALEKCPGYTRDPSALQLAVTSVLGPNRSSGRTLHNFAPPPELVATFAALEAVRMPPEPRAADVDPQLDAATTAKVAGGAPSCAPVGVVQQRKEAPRSESATTRKAHPPRRADPGVPPNAEDDAPRLFRKRRLRKLNDPTPTAVLPVPAAEPSGFTARQGHLAASPRSTEDIPVPWEVFERAGPKRETGSPVPATANPTRAMQTEPSPVPGGPSRSTGGSAAPALIDTRTTSIEPIADEPMRSNRIAGLLIAVLVVGLGGAVWGAHWAGIFGVRDSESAQSGLSAAARTEAQEATPLSPTDERETSASHGSVDLQPVQRAAADPIDVGMGGPPPTSTQTLPGLPTLVQDGTETEPTATGRGRGVDRPSLSAAEPSRAQPVPGGNKPPTARPRAKAPPPEVLVTVVVLLVEEAEVEIGQQRVNVSASTDVRIPAGRHRVRWRLLSEDLWHDGGRRTFSRQRSYLVRLRPAGALDFVEQRQPPQGRQ